MSKKTILWLITATALMVIGCMIFGGVMTMLNWDFTALSTSKYETNRYDIQEDYTHISITTDTANVAFVPCENSTTSVVCYEQKNVSHSVTVHDGTLKIELNDTRKWYEHIGIHFGTPKITIYLPDAEYGALTIKGSTGDIEIPKDFRFKSVDITADTGDVTNLASASDKLKITTSTGDIHVENISANTLDLSVATGKITASGVTCEGDITLRISTGVTDMTDVHCQNLTSSGNTGDISLNNVIAAEKFSIKRSTGDVRFDGSDAAEIFVETDTGNVRGSLLTDKLFITQTDTGRVDVPKTVIGGRCEITTDTGNISITIP